MSRGKIETAFPLTPLQEGLLLYTVRHPGSGVYRGQVTAEFVGPMDDDRLIAAWQQVARRHQAFRSFFAWEGRDRPLQVVREEVPLEWTVLDWSSLADSEQGRLWSERVEEDRRTAFDLWVAPIMRFLLVHLREDRHRVLWTLHHALADGWSASLVLKEVTEAYERLGEGDTFDEPLPPSFAKLVAWLNFRDRPAAERYWRSRLAGLRDATPLPAAPNRPAGTERTQVDVQLDADAMARLRGAAARMRVTPNTIAVGAWAIVLARYTSEAEDVTFGVTIAERPTEIPGVEQSVGLYLSTVPLRVPVRGDVPVADWLSDLQRQVSDSREHSAGGVGDIRRWSEIESGGSLAHSVVVYESFPPDAVTPDVRGSLRLEQTTISAPSELPLSLLVYPGERLGLHLEYDPSLYTEAEALGLLEGVTHVFQVLIGESDLTLDQIQVVGPETRTMLIDEWSGADLALPPVRDVIDLFERRAAETPEAPAVEDAECSVTYAEVDAAANRLSRRILEEVPEADGLLGIPAEPRVGTIVALLAALKAGRGYTLFDPNQPESRVASILRHVHAVLATSDDTRWPVRTLSTDDPATGPALKPEVAVDERAIAYVVWTSGSTGEPKGVVVERGHLSRSTAARLAYYGDAPGVFLMLSSLAVDSSVAGLYGTLCSGGCLVLPAHRAEQDVDGLAELIQGRSITSTLLVPSLYRALLEEVAPARMASLQTVMVAGEACSSSLLSLHERQLPTASLYNEYGPSEATVWASVADLTAESDGRVTIGRPVPYVRVYLLDPEGRPVPVGAPGEICLAGSTVARGYLGDPELTAERFRPDPFVDGERMYRTGDRARFLDDGRLDFLGRVDDQIKIRGYRVEPAEIERALAAHPAVTEAMVAIVSSESASDFEDDVDALVDTLSSLPGDTVELLLRNAEAAQ